MVRTTSARPSGARPAVPAKMTSSIIPPRNDFAPCSPSTQAMASTTLDLPDPLGPTTQVMPGSKRSVVEDAKDLKPRRVRLFRCTRTGLHGFGGGEGRVQTSRTRPGSPSYRAAVPRNHRSDSGQEKGASGNRKRLGGLLIRPERTRP